MDLSPRSEELDAYLRTVRYSSWSFTELVQSAPSQVVVRVKVVRTGFEPVNTVYGTEPTALNKIVPDGILFANRELNASTNSAT